MKAKKKGSVRRKPSPAWTQDERRALGAKLIVSIALTAEELTALDRMRRGEARGVFIGELLRSL